MFGDEMSLIIFNKYIVRENCNHFKAGEIVFSKSKLDKKNIRVTNKAQDKIVWCKTGNLLSIFDLFQQNRKYDFTAIGFKTQFNEQQPYWLADINRIYLKSYCSPYRFDGTGEALYFIKHNTKLSLRSLIITKWDFTKWQTE